MLFQSTGRLHYYKNWLVLYIDQGIADFYRSLIPKARYVQGQAYPAHITVVRKGVENPDMTHWSRYNGKKLKFSYDPYIHNDDTYYWLDAWSGDLNNIRMMFNLPAFRKGFDRFHITIGNTKQ